MPSSVPSVALSLVLAADQPAELARFYGALLQQPPQSGQSPTHWRVPLPDGGWLELYAPSRERPVPRQRGRLALCLQVASLQAWLERARQAGGELLEPPRQEPFGREAWLCDPEGNALLLLEPGVAAASP